MLHDKLRTEIKIRVNAKDILRSYLGALKILTNKCRCKWVVSGTMLFQ